MSGEIIDGLIKSITEERVGERIKITTRHYDPESSPPVILSEHVKWMVEQVFD